jgi:hypothetical protein
VATRLPASENQQSIFGEDFAVRGVRYCPNWVVARITHCWMGRLADPFEARRGAHIVTGEGTGRSIRIANGKEIGLRRGLSFVAL